MSATALALLLALCLAGAAFAAGMETGVIALNRLRLQHQLRRNVRGAATIRWFLTRPDVLLSTTLVATNLLHVGAAVLAALLGARLGGHAGAAAAGVLLTVTVLVFCEYLPKAWFQAAPSSRVLPFAGLLKALAIVLWPLTAPVNAVMRRLSRQARGDPDAHRLLVSREELLLLASEGVQSGVLTPAETEMIHGIFSLTHKNCSSLMTPRDRMVVLPPGATCRDLLETARRHAFSRYPLYDPATRAWTGTVHLFDVLADPAVTPDSPIAPFARPPQFVAGYTPADHILPRMRLTRSPLFLVTDDRYEVVGLVTLEDVLQEITGEE